MIAQVLLLAVYRTVCPFTVHGNDSRRCYRRDCIFIISMIKKNRAPSSFEPFVIPAETL
jgi:hypothetical protein